MLSQSMMSQNSSSQSVRGADQRLTEGPLPPYPARWGTGKESGQGVGMGLPQLPETHLGGGVGFSGLGTEGGLQNNGVCDWRAGASLPSRPNGAIFLYIYLFIYLYPALMYAVMFYVILNKRKLH